MPRPTLSARFWLVPIAVVVVLLSVVLTGPRFAQTHPPLFLELMPQASGEPPLGVAAVFPAVLNLADLPFAPPAIDIELPSGEIVTATLTRFEPIAGFDPVTGDPLPDATLEDLSYVWIGKGGGNEVILSVVEGVMTGIVHGDSGQFDISAAGGQALRTLVPEELPSEEGDTSVAPAPAPVVATGSAAAVPAVPAKRVPLPKVIASEERVIIGLLVFYTDLARQQANGDPTDPGNATLISLVYTGVWALNVAFDNSLVNAEVRIVGIQQFDEVQPSGSGGLDVRDLRSNPTAQSLRNQFEADVVTLIFPDTPTPGVDGCGRAITQRPGCADPGEDIAGCTMLDGFNDYAYNWVARNCVLGGRFSLGHEVLHNMGAEHDEINAVSRDLASFPWAFGHHIDSQHRTMMALASFVASTRVLFISNPDVTFNGSPAGAEENNNAAAIRFLMHFMEGFRGSDIFLFGDEFERGDLIFWSEVGS